MDYILQINSDLESDRTKFESQSMAEENQNSSFSALASKNQDTKLTNSQLSSNKIDTCQNNVDRQFTETQSGTNLA